MRWLHAALWGLCLGGCTGRAIEIEHRESDGGAGLGDNAGPSAATGDSSTGGVAAEPGAWSTAEPQASDGDGSSVGGTSGATGESTSETATDGVSTSGAGSTSGVVGSTSGGVVGSTSGGVVGSTSGGVVGSTSGVVGSTSGVVGSTSGGGAGSTSGVVGSTSGAASGSGALSGGGSAGSSGAGAGTTGGPVEPPPAREILFNTPTLSGDADLTLEDQLVAMIKSAVVGSSIRVALYRLSRMSVAEALLAAKSRGVDVRIVLDNGNGFAPGTPECPGTELCPYEALLLLRDNFAAHELIECNAELYGQDPYGNGEPGCNGSVSNGNKFYLFSELDDGSTNVVVQSTIDPTYFAQCYHGSMFITRGDLALYDAYQAFWTDLAAERLDSDYAWETPGDFGETYLHFFPRAKVDPYDAEDTVLEVLENVGCAPGASIRVAQSFWSLSRAGIAAKLSDLETAGCEVRVIMTERQDNVDPRDYGLQTAMFPATGPACGGDRFMGQHHRVILIDAPYGAPGEQVWQRRVVTGSHSYSFYSLRNNDETLLHIAHDQIYDAYLAVWESLWLDIVTLGGG